MGVSLTPEQLKEQKDERAAADQLLDKFYGVFDRLDLSLAEIRQRMTSNRCGCTARLCDLAFTDGF
mgnify:FL=1